MVQIKGISSDTVLRKRRRRSIDHWRWLKLAKERLHEDWMIPVAILGFIILVGSLNRWGRPRIFSHQHRGSRPLGGSLLHSLHQSLSSPPDVWCQTSECRSRLEDLKSKLDLEEMLYQEQFDRERKRLLNHTDPRTRYTKEKIIAKRLRQIRKDLDAAAEEAEDLHRYTPPHEWMGKSYPEINIAGVIKTGTSQLYNIFATHRDVVRIDGDEKEHCSFDHAPEEQEPESDVGDDDDDEKESEDSDTPPDTYEYQLYAWHRFYFDHYEPNRQRINGCLVQEEIERQIVFAPPSKDVKFFVLLRDPADWMYASYAFWTDTSWENNEGRKNWVDENLHYRSPEAFHEVIISGGKLSAMEMFDEIRATSVSKLLRLRALVGKENLIVLKNEDLQPNRIVQSGVLQKLIDATGLSRDGFDESVLHSRSNCNANKGFEEKCSDSDRDGDDSYQEHPRVGYPVTQHRPMFESTRRFIYLQWSKECKIWAKVFGIVYPECLAAVPDDNLDELLSLLNQ